MNIPTHYKLVEESPHSYEIHDERDGKNFHIAKQNLSLSMHGKLSKIQKFVKGGEVEKIEDVDLKQMPPLQVESTEGAPAHIAIEPIPETNSNLTIESIPDTFPSKEPIPQAQTKPVEEKNKETPEPDQELKAIKDAAQAQADEAKNTAAAYQKVENQISALPNTLEIWQANKKKNQALFDAFDSDKIDRNRVVNDMSTGQKFLLGISLIFGGAAAGRHGENKAMTILNDAINRDIDAQKNEQHKKYNLWRMNMEATQNEALATAESRTQSLTLAETIAKKEAAKAAGPVAQAAWAEKISAIEKQKEASITLQSFLKSASMHEVIDDNPLDLLRSQLIAHPELKEIIQKGIQEVQNMDQLKKMEDNVVEAINHVMNLPRWQRGFSGAEAERQAFVGPLAKQLEGTFSETQAKGFANSFFSSVFQLGGRPTDELKRELFQKQMGAKQEGKNFEMVTGIPLSKFRSTRLGTITPKTQTKIDRSHEVNDRRTYELIKNSKDKEDQGMVYYLKNKYGFK